MVKTTQPAKNLLLLITEDFEIGSISGSSDHKIVERSPFMSKNLIGATGYLIPDAKQAFIQLRQAFTKASILQHFDPKYHIRIKTDMLGYAISGLLSQLILDNLGQWHLIVFYLQKMILAKTRYKTYNNERLAIAKGFKTW